MEKELKTTRHFIVLSAVIIFGLLLMSVRQLETDIMQHYKLGEYIQHNGIPAHDVFSWQQNLSTMCHEWLYEIILYKFYSFAGDYGLRISLFVVQTGLLLIIYKYNEKHISTSLLFTAYMILLYLRSYNSRCVRPQEISIMLLVQLIMLLRDKKESFKRYMLTFFISVLNTNIHGGSIVMLFMIPILFSVADAARFIIKKENVSRDIIENAESLGVIIAGTMLNPYGPHIWKYFLSSFQTSSISSHIQEWMQPELTMPQIIIMVGTFIAMSMDENTRNFEKSETRDIVLMAACVSYGAVRIRMTYVSTIIVMLLGYKYVDKFFMTRVLHGWKPKEKFVQICKNIIAVPVLIVSVISALIINYNYISTNVSYADTVRNNNKDIYSVVDYINDNSLQNEKIWNAFADGSYFIFNGLKPFVDPRCDPYVAYFSPGNTSLEDNMKAIYEYKNDPYDEFTALKEKYGFNYAVVSKDTLQGRLIVQELKDNNAEMLVETETYCLLDVRSISTDI